MRVISLVHCLASMSIHVVTSHIDRPPVLLDRGPRRPATSSRGHGRSPHPGHARGGGHPQRTQAWPKSAGRRRTRPRTSTRYVPCRTRSTATTVTRAGTPAAAWKTLGKVDRSAFQAPVMGSCSSVAATLARLAAPAPPGHREGEDHFGAYGSGARPVIFPARVWGSTSSYGSSGLNPDDRRAAGPVSSWRHHNEVRDIHTDHKTSSGCR